MLIVINILHSSDNFFLRLYIYKVVIIETKQYDLLEERFPYL